MSLASAVSFNSAPPCAILVTHTLLLRWDIRPYVQYLVQTVISKSNLLEKTSRGLHYYDDKVNSLN